MGFVWIALAVLAGLIFAVLVSASFWVKPRIVSIALDAAGMVFPKRSRPDPIYSLDSTHAFEKYVREEVASSGIVGGVAVARIRPNEPIWSYGHGHANYESRLAITADTPFGLGSVSKTFVAVTLMQATEDGYLTLDTEINDLLPFEIKNPHNQATSITMRHLATHTSSIQDHTWTYLTKGYFRGDSPISLEDFLKSYLLPDGELFSAGRCYLEAMPGEEVSYSNIATALTAYVISLAVEQPFEVYTRERIFEPLGMQNTGWFLSEFVDPNVIAMPYNRIGQPYGYLGLATWPDGQLRSSVNDVSRFLAAIINEGELDGKRLMAKDSLQEMLRVQFPDMEPEDDEEQAIFWAQNEKGWIGHNGDDPGVFTLMFFDPETKHGGVVLMNSMNRKTIGTGVAILKKLII
ncbi:MAG: serine hydrolase domain-containing protein [Chloroflexota bacterium]